MTPPTPLPFWVVTGHQRSPLVPLNRMRWPLHFPWNSESDAPALWPRHMASASVKRCLFFVRWSISEVCSTIKIVGGDWSRLNSLKWLVEPSRSTAMPCGVQSTSINSDSCFIFLSGERHSVGRRWIVEWMMYDYCILIRINTYSVKHHVYILTCTIPDPNDIKSILKSGQLQFNQL